MTKYELACDKRITMMAILFEILMIVACVLLVDASLEHFWGIQTMIASHVPFHAALIAVIVLQYVLVSIELIARNRDECHGLTLPLAFIPGGTIVRTLLMTTLATLVIAFKLVVYFVSVLLAFVFQILHVDKFLGTSRWVDGIDGILEPLEMSVNRLYNSLYFHKIRANTSVFSSVFNGCLSFWCINH